MGHTTLALLLGMLRASLAAEQQQHDPSVHVGSFKQEGARSFGEEHGLPDQNVHCITEGPDGVVYAGTGHGVARYVPAADGQPAAWAPLDPAMRERIGFLDVAESNRLMAVGDDNLLEWTGVAWKQVAALPGAKPTAFCAKGVLALGTDEGLFLLEQDGFVADSTLNQLLTKGETVHAVVDAGDPWGLTVATGSGIFARGQGPWHALLADDVSRSWAMRDAKCLALDAQGRLWFAAPQGVGYARPDNAGWRLFSGEDGLPHNDFTCMRPGETAASGETVMWFGTTKGAIRYDGKNWGYRQSRRWLPADHVRSVRVDRVSGDAWFATRQGVGIIERRPMTLAEKAKYYEDEIDKHHRRTTYGYVAQVYMKTPGDKSTIQQIDTDNDGLWTSMYGAGECFAYAATKSLEAKKRAKDAFEALRFLQVVTQGGEHAPPKGFVARTVLPISEPNPNTHEYTPERDQFIKDNHDDRWKVMPKRWPVSADGQWYWKCDTSSDELDGHYFFYPLYYDLVADTDDEKERVREVVRDLTDHLVDHDFCLVDYDGKPTRWAVFSPSELNANPAWFVERGLNSVSMLSYLCTAHYVTREQRYLDTFDDLVKNKGYASNMLMPKLQNGVASGNQSDDEMAFMSFYNLVKYCPDKMVRGLAAYAFKQYWILEQPELNPFFNFLFAGACTDVDIEIPMAEMDHAPEGDWLDESVETLMRFPLDRCSWSHENSGRIDIVPLPGHIAPRHNRGKLRNGCALPVDERYFAHWNHDPWVLDVPSKHAHGRELGSGAVYLLPYYMGIYHKFIVEDQP